MEEKTQKKDRKWLWLLLLLLLLFLFYFFLGKNKTKTGNIQTAEGNKYVQCFKTAADTPAGRPGWVGQLYSAPLKNESSERGTKDNGVREFSLAKMIEKTGDSVYYRLERTGFAEKEFVTGAKLILEICDDNNKTSEFYSVTNNKLQPAGDKISASVLHMHNNPKVFRPGKYRVDALINVDGNWELVNRIEGITIRE